MAAKRVFLAATGQNRGKTTTSLALLAAIRDRGLRLGFVKPVGQRYLVVAGTRADEDACGYSGFNYVLRFGNGPVDAIAAVDRAMGGSPVPGSSTMNPLNPAWDQRWMDALAQGGPALDALSGLSEDSIEREGGLSAHESKTWLVARSALPSDSALPCTLRHYQAIPEYIAGFGLMWLQSTH